MLVTELRIYQIAFQLRDELHIELNSVPHYWKIKDVEQTRESSSSIPSNITESHSRRFYPKDYVHFLNMALGSGDETQNHVNAMGSNGLLPKDRAEYFFRRYKDLSIRIVNYINSLRSKNSLTKQLGLPSGLQTGPQ